jgi:tRNA A-37 threonylcarbamoyl transferase component Bud32
MKCTPPLKIPTYFVGFFLFLFLITLNPTLSLALEGGPLYITSNIPGAIIYLDDNQIGKTDAKGGFLFDHVPEGTHKITLEMEGYQKTEKTITIKGGDLTEIAHFNLQSKTQKHPSSVEPKVSKKKIEASSKTTEQIAKAKPTPPPIPSLPQLQEEKKEIPVKPLEHVAKPEPSIPLPTKPPGKQVSGTSTIPTTKKLLSKEVFDSRVIILIFLMLIGISLLILVIKANSSRKKMPLEKKLKTPLTPLKTTTSIKVTGLKGPQIIGNYKVIEKIAFGGMAIIYKATHITKGGVVVLKVPYEQFQNDQIFIERFRREADLGKKLHNENIIHIYESGTSKDGFTYIAMEYLDGISLRHYLNKYGKMSIKDALKTIVPVCRALDYAHVKGVIHRDIKPENIMLPKQKGKGRIVLMDFGIARAVYLGTVGTKTAFLGTPYYMSPDQISVEEIDARSDIYSLGVVFFEMFAGRPPFNETDPLKLLYQHKVSPPPRLISLNPEVPAVIESIILKMLHKGREDRYQSVESLLVTLQDYMLKEGIEIE